jgi:hypothetical protein
MINCDVALGAERLIRDAENDTISVIGLLEGIGAAGFPLAMQKIAFFFRLTRESGDPAQLELTIRISLGENELTSASVRADFQEKMRTRIILNVMPLLLPGPGTVSAQLSMGDRTLGHYEFIVTQVQQPVVQQAS